MKTFPSVDRGRRATLIAMLAAGAAPAAFAQADYPNRPIKFVVAQAAGSAGDALARLIGTRLADVLGQAVVVENRAGANGIIGVQSVAKAAPDGYTFVIGTTPNLAINAALYKQLPYDPLTDISSVANVAKTYYTVLVPASSPANSLKELIALARSKPGQLTYGAGSTGAQANIEIFSAAAKIKMTHVPYKSSSQALLDIAGGRVDMIFDTPATAMPHVQSGKVKALAVTSLQRLPQYPNTPTVAETEIPGYEYASWVAINGPGGLPAAIQRRISTEVQKILAQPDIAERFRTIGFEPVYASPEQLSAMLRRDIDAYRKIIRELGIPLLD
ncbi:Bug family tripartite tricarboxylate transporter substrate binding protein [Ramlibacter sp.]|uniref:Bug family tripartite tricarboxylate transporter substrate binding protein n=1 Tax=Ramlibacter sp. TaxID=1917967 RepID=UPI003D11E3A6